MPKQTGISDVSDSPPRSIRNQAAVARALVVGEDERVRRHLSWRLRKAGFTVRVTDNGMDALNLSHGDPPDLIVLDHLVGWLDVRYLLTRWRHDVRTAQTPILMIAPCADDALACDCQRLGVTLVVWPGNERPRGPMSTWVLPDKLEIVR